MNLPEKDAELFHKLYPGLLVYANRVLRVGPRFDSLGTRWASFAPAANRTKSSFGTPCGSIGS